MRKAIILIFLFSLCLPFRNERGIARAATNPISEVNLKVDPQLQASLDSLQPGETTTVIVALTQQADLSQIGNPDQASHQRGVLRALQATARNGQQPIKAFLDARRGQGLAGQATSFWVFNGLSVTATREVIQELAARPDVQSISPDAIDIVPTAPLEANPEGNLSVVNAPALWNLGFSGQGVVVANMDTGVDINHPELASRWRGGANSWYDPYGQHPNIPTDLSGHGTGTMGVMVGGEAGGTAIGMAPQAQWIAVKILNDAGSATATAIHLGFQWLLDPDGNPNTADAPRVVNNSWAYGSPGCNLAFQPDLQALRAAGILPVFSAGNYGPSASTSVSPANYPEALSVGAVTDSGLIYAYSSRGPTSCGQAQAIYPSIVAPGVNIWTTNRFGLYGNLSGTSLAAPHASGALALLLSAYPTLSVAQQEAALKSATVDLGVSGPDNIFGYGRLDVLAAYQWLANGGSQTPTPTATWLASPSPTPTFTASPSGTATTLPTSTPTFTPLPSNTPTAPPTFTATPTASATALPSPTPTFTGMPTATATLPPSPTPSATATPPPSATPTASATLPPGPTPTSTAALPDVIFADGFETGNLNAWSAASKNGGRLSVTAAGGLSGAYGMQALINNTTSMYVADLSPVTESAYHARFYFSPNSVSISALRSHPILVGNLANGSGIFYVTLTYSGEAYQLRASLRANNGRESATNWYTISNASHAIEVAWQAASTASGSDGAISLWVDGVLKETLTGIANGSYRLEEVRLGPQFLASGISGTEYFDAFVSSRNTYLGP